MHNNNNRIISGELITRIQSGGVIIVDIEIEIEIPVSAAETSSFGEDQLQFGSGASGDERTDERQSVLIEISL